MIFLQYVLLFLSFKSGAGSTLQISIDLTAPSNIPTLSPSFLSYSIEQDRWTDWVGTTSRSQFFFNTLQNLKQLSGESPRIRIGANSEDKTIYDSNVKFAEAIFPAPSANVPYPEATNISVGAAYYTTAQFLPSNTQVTWGLNLGRKNLTATFLEAKALLKAFSSPKFKSAGIVLEAIEIGNEADLYANNGLRAQGYDVATYVKEWGTFAENVSVALNLSSKSSPHFWGASFAGSSGGNTTGFSPQAIIEQGILNTHAGSHIKTISQHRYSGSFCAGSAGLLQDLMTKDTIRGNLTVFAPDIKAVRSKGLDYLFGETNSYACHGAPGVSNTAGAGLWMLDYLFFASQIGISRVYFHQGIGFKYNLVQPAVLPRSPTDATPLTTPLAPHIQPAYYTAVIAAEIAGQGKANGKAGSLPKVVELAIDNPRVSGYAFYTATDGYHTSTLSSLLLINSQGYFRSQGNATSRGKIHIDLTYPAIAETPTANSTATNSTATPNSAFPQTMTIKRLAIPYADDTSGITWAGQTYETSSGKVSGKLKTEKIALEAGFDLSDTEAVLVYLD